MTSSDALSQSTDASGASDSASIEDLGRELTGSLGSLDIGMVACWYRVEDAVLAHVVARELRVPISYAFDSEGLLSLSGPVNGASVALVAVDFPHANDLPGLSGVVRSGGGEINAVATGQLGLDLAGTAAEGAVTVDPGRK